MRSSRVIERVEPAPAAADGGQLKHAFGA